MKIFLAVVLAAFFALPVAAQQGADSGVSSLVPEGDSADLTKFLWKNRVLIVFSDSAGDPRFTEQMHLLAARPGDLVERDVVLLIDTDPAAQSALREKLRPRGFMLVLLAKDGTVVLRKPLPWDVREISRSIDKLPLRQQELRDRPLSP